MLAWHNDQAIRDDAVTRMRAHRERDRLRTGEYLSARVERGMIRVFQGCFLGCLVAEKFAEERHTPVLDWVPDLRRRDAAWWHGETERLFGIPAVVAGLLDDGFEDATDPEVFALMATEAIPVGADLTMVPHRLLLDHLTDPEYGVIPASTYFDELGLRQRCVAQLTTDLLVGFVVSAGWRALAETASDAAAPGSVYYPVAANVAEFAEAIQEAGWCWPQHAARQINETGTGVQPHWEPDWWNARLIHHLATAPVPTPVR